MDLAGASLLLTLAAPLLVLCALAVMIESGRPVFFGHLRVGRGGRLFRCWKFRTMTPDAERRLREDPALAARHRENGFKLPTGEDPRITRVGRCLRRWYLDELPQLFNVLTGSMSLVGPRPVVPEELAEFHPCTAELLSVKPGLFGAWVILGPERPAYPLRAAVELEYVRHRSLVRDLQILLRSPGTVLKGEPGT
jgi:lipopolysaccharide/colanic/teichoic acid biosynthesis glycosyltransferase